MCVSAPEDATNKGLSSDPEAAATRLLPEGRPGTLTLPPRTQRAFFQNTADGPAGVDGNGLKGCAEDAV